MGVRTVKKTTSKNLYPIQETGLTVPDPLDPKYVGPYDPPPPYQKPFLQKDIALNVAHKQGSDTCKA